jgi:thiamine biosynthesis lipoprotein
VAAVWAVAGTTRLADGLTTALYFASPARLRETFEFEYAMVYTDGRLERSAHFPADFFIKETA